MNPYKRLKDIIQGKPVSRDDLIHSLMATVFLECCESCIDKLHSDEYMQRFEKRLQEMDKTRELSRRFRWFERKTHAA
jgi:hypothetical protein